MSRAFGFFLAVSVASASVTLGACVWDWTVRGAQEIDASAADARASDAVASEAGASDANSDADATDAAVILEASDCSVLLAAVSSAKAQAITCTLGSIPDCSTSITDECGCGVFVGQSGSTASQHFASAVDQAKAAGCTSQCVGCGALPTRGTCVEFGVTFICSPP